MSIRNFSVLCLSFAALCVAGIFFGGEWIADLAGVESYMYVALTIVLLSTLVSYVIVINGIKNRMNLFTSYVMGGMLIRMFVGLISMTIVALRFKPYATVYVLSYFFLYFIFTAFEVVALMRTLRAEK